MTIDEVSERYNIPIEILRKYQSWGLCNAVKEVMEIWEYDDRDLERLSIIMTLHDIGFTSTEVEKYINLLLQGESTENERLNMLNHRRCNTLDEIHLQEKKLERLDYLRHEIKKAGKTRSD